MKKSLLALAALSAFATAAQAQSSVELFGRIDTGYSDLNVDASSHGTAASVSNRTTTGISFSNFLTSRWGFKGTEDLGGGLKASFMVESQLAAQRSGTTTQEFGGRGLYLDLAGSFGSIRAGRMDTMTKALYDTLEVGSSNNLRGTLTTIGVAQTGQRDNGVRFTTPTMSGFSASAAVVKNTIDDPLNTATGTSAKLDVDAGSGQEFGVTYNSGKFEARAVTRTAKTKNQGSATLAATVGGSTFYTTADEATLGAVDTATATDSKAKSNAFGAGYDFGVAKVTAQYWDVKTTNNLDATKTSDVEAMYVGVRVPMGKTTLFASYIDGENTTNNVKLDRTGYNVGAMYSFSKRTTAYVAYGEDEVGTSAGKDTKADQIAVGLVHTF
jgi:predicted porin